MTLQQLIEQYIAHRKSLGEQQNTNGGALRSFGRAIGAEVDVADVRPDQVNAFLASSGPVTLNWHFKHSVLRNFYRYAVSRGYVTVAPLPSAIPKLPPPFVPYIYSRDDLRRLLQAFDADKRPQTCMEPVTMRTILLLLYGAGLRLQEATDLNREDVVFKDSVMTVRQTKFGKTRLVPFGEQLGHALTSYAARAAQSQPDAPFFATRTGNRVKPDTLRHNYRILCDRAGVRRTDGARYQPRIHDLRHTFAVHRLTSWYQQGADVKTLLPLLSVYMGHVHLRHTQVYLSMTPELLHEAGKRFRKVRRKGGSRMTDNALLGPWLRRFLLEHLVSERNRSRNTQRSYRDTFCQLLQFIERVDKNSRIDRLHVEDLTADRIRAFLTSIEEERGCSPATRNQRLAAIHSLAHFVALHSPEHLQWCGEIRAILAKKTQQSPATYLEKGEMDDLLGAPNQDTALGKRDYVVLLFLYNTGARADEVANVKIGNLDLGQVPERDMSSVLIHGKGNKQRRCPLWPKTVTALLPLVGNRSSSERVFLNRRQQPLTRFGVHGIVTRHAERVATARPSLAQKGVSPHVIRHTTAMHLLRAEVDINTIRAWLGHVCLSTTNVYADADLEMKAKALALCEVKDGDPPQERWRDDKGLMEFLRTL